MNPALLGGAFWQNLVNQLRVSLRSPSEEMPLHWVILLKRFSRRERIMEPLS
jgi:hypothetical protein